MAISSTNRVAGPFAGDGVTATFPFTFKAFAASDLYVAKIAAGAIAVLALTTDYSVALNADQDAAPGGTITLAAGALASGSTLIITTTIGALQNLDLTNGGGFYPDVVNAALDTLTILVQQLLVQAGMAVQAPLAETGAAVMELPPAAQRAGKVLMFDAAGNASLVSLAPGGTIPGGQAAVGTVDGANKVFTFAASSLTTPVPLVFIAGIFQTPGTDYTIGAASGDVWPITFADAPAAGPVTVVLLA